MDDYDKYLASYKSIKKKIPKPSGQRHFQGSQ